MKTYPELRRGGCAYIAKELEDPSWSYCNQPIACQGASWCPEHMAVVYQKGTRVRDIEGLARVYK